MDEKKAGNRFMTREEVVQSYLSSIKAAADTLPEELRGEFHKVVAEMLQSGFDKPMKMG